MQNNIGYPPAVAALMQAYKVECDEDVADVLQKGGIDPATIKHVFYRYVHPSSLFKCILTFKDASSHLHCDHMGDLTKFPSAEIVLAADAKVLLKDAYPKNPNAYFEELPAGRPVTYLRFSPDASSQHKTLSPFSTFERAVDFYGDGSFYIVEAPGHIPGHFGALARVAPNSFVFFAADMCHNRECYAPGTRQVSGGNHVDVAVARETVTRLIKMDKEVQNVVIVLSHDKDREVEMPLFPHELCPWVVAEINKRKLMERE